MKRKLVYITRHDIGLLKRLRWLRDIYREDVVVMILVRQPKKNVMYRIGNVSTRDDFLFDDEDDGETDSEDKPRKKLRCPKQPPYFS